MTTPEEDNAVHAELVRLALQLREDLFDLAETLAGNQALAKVMDSAGALIVAITDPPAPLPGPTQAQSGAQIVSFPRQVKPTSLH